MTLFNLDGLLALFAEADRPRIVTALERVAGVAVYRHDESLRVSLQALTPEPDRELPDGSRLLGTYMRPVQDSRTQRALHMIRSTGCSAYAASKAIGISPSAISRALKRERQPHCPCCGQSLTVKA